MRSWRVFVPVAVLAAAAALVPRTHAQAPDYSAIEIKTEKVAEGVYMLAGAGGNIGLSAGEDGAFLIDDEFAPLTAKIRAAVAAVSPQPIRFLINTHWHFDHTGGNENLGQAGVVIVAHENVRRRMSAGQLIESLKMQIPPAPPKALPVVTFPDTVTFHLNGDELRAFHVPPAHTDGDTVIHFTRADVFHTGDLFFSGAYPFIDLSSGGSLQGMITAVEILLEQCGPRTRIIPGHGPVSDRAALQKYHDVLVLARDRVGALVKQGKTLDEIKAAKPMADHDAEWGAGFVKPDMFLEIAYRSLTAKS